MWLKFAVILFLMGLVQPRPQNTDIFEAEETHRRNRASTADKKDSALLDNRYSGNRTNRRINANNDYTRFFNLIGNLKNRSIFNLENNRRNVHLYNDSNTNGNHTSQSISSNDDSTATKNPNKTLRNRLMNTLKSNFVGRLIKGLKVMLNKNSKLANVSSLQAKSINDNKVDSKQSVNLLPESTKLSSNVIQFADNVPTGDPMNLINNSEMHNYDIKQYSFDDQTPAIITLAKNDKSDDHKESRTKHSWKTKSENSTFLKNWPDSGLVSSQDLDYYEKYTSLRLDDKNNFQKLTPILWNKTSNIKTKNANKSEIFSELDTKWTKIPAVILDKNPEVEFQPLDDFEPNKPLVPVKPENLNTDPTYKKNVTFTVPAPVSQITHDTTIHIYNPPSNGNATKIEGGDHKVQTNFPPKKVHIVFSSSKNESEYLKNQLNETFDPDCPTITINSMTRVNSTVQSKEGCTDLNIIINSHILNSNVDKVSGELGGQDATKITSFEVFQGTHININSASLEGFGGGDTKFVVGEGTEEVSTTTEAESSTNDYDEYYTTDDDKDEIESETEAGQTAEGQSSSGQSSGGQSSGGQFSGGQSSGGSDVAQAAPAAEGGTNAVAPPASTALATTSEDDEDDEDEDDFSPVGIMEYFTSLFSRSRGTTLKDLKDIDLSLRTVATQLLNISNHDGVAENAESTSKIPYIIKNITTAKKDVHKNTASSKTETKTEPTTTDTTSLIYGRPINSKFSYFGSGHPGEAMALTEEEIEREINLTKIVTTQKNEATTTGGISTWILLNPPSTSMKNLFDNATTSNIKVETTPPTKPPLIKGSVNVTTFINKVLESAPDVKVSTLEIKNNSEIQFKVDSTSKKPAFQNPKPVKLDTTVKPTSETKPFNQSKPSSSTTVRTTGSKEPVTTLKPITTTKKIVPTTQEAVRNSTSKIVAVSPSSLNKTVVGQIVRPKNPTKRVTPKPNTNKTDHHYTSKIEKVTLKPIQLTTTEKVLVDSNEQPYFTTKLKGTITTAPKKHNNTNPNINKLQEMSVKLKPNQSNKINTSLTMQEKKHVTEINNASVKPVKVNAPLLKIEKPDTETKLTKVSDSSDNFTKVVTPVTPTTTTKRPRHSSKRKRNKLRRRKPSRTTTEVSLVSLITNDDATTGNAQELQESKIEPDSKVAQTNSTKNKQNNKNPISTQIYNFLSREVMPSFGVMSLVGLGLGLASYFLYPFGGAITRRNYAIEPNYKYNLDEYGGATGQNEEEVLKQVFQGMTTHDNTNNQYSNYYHYHGYNEANADSTKKNVNPRHPAVNDSKQKPVDNPNVKINYRNLDYKYQEIGHPVKIEDSKQSHTVESVTSDINGNRQFVVGSVMKDFVTDPPRTDFNFNLTESSPVIYDDSNSFYTYAKQGNQIPNVYDIVDEDGNKSNDENDKIEKGSTIVAVEHGPRAIKFKRSVDVQMDMKKDSAIQVIPLKNEESGKEESLSNEIFNIIDSVIPDNDQEMMNKKNKFYDNKLVTKGFGGTPKQPVLNEVEMTTPVSSELSSEASESKYSQSTSADETTKEISSEKVTQPTMTNVEKTTVQWMHSYNHTEQPTTQEPPEKFNIFNFVRNVAEVKFRLGLTLLKHASEGFTRYISHVQKRLNGEA